MKNIPQYAMVTGILFVLITLAGGGAWYWTSGELQAKIEQRQKVEGEIKRISGSGIFPNAQNLKTVEENVAAVEASLAPIEPIMMKTSALLEPVRGKGEEGKPPPGLSPDAWKSLLTETRTELLRLANEHGVKLPEEYYFGFKDYQLNQPPAAHTLQMGVQLLAIKEICSTLFKSGIAELKNLKRVKVETAGTAAAAAAASEETLAGSTAVSKDQFYRVYPFEVSFVTTPEALEKVTAALAASPFFLVIRDMVVENPKISLARRSEVIGAATGGGAGAGANQGLGTGAAAPQSKLLVTVSGTEDIQVRMRLSLIEWAAPDLKPVEPAASKPPANEKPPKKKRQ